MKNASQAFLGSSGDIFKSDYKVVDFLCFADFDRPDHIPLM
jgi:hypothetical protein